MVKRSPTLSGHHATISQSSMDSNGLERLRSRHNSLSTRPQLAIDTVMPSTPERIYNSMFASGVLKDFMRENQKLESKFYFFFFLSVSHEYVCRYPDI
jgi:hypothetical protein